jgi:predicted porin
MTSNNRAWAAGLLALLAASGAAAQGSVTLYGRINMTVESQKNGSNGRIVSVENSSSRWGLRGTEDLGGGLKASFKLESGFDPSTGQAAGTFWGRESWMALEGEFGKVRLGNMTNITYLTSADFVSMHNHDTGTSSDALFAFGVNFGAKQNTIAYATPVFNGFQAEISHALKEDGPYGSTNAVLNYDSGALHLGFGVAKRDANRMVVARGLYELGAFTFGGYYERDSFAGVKRSNLRLVGMYAVDQHEFHLNFGAAGDRGGPDTGARQYTLGYNYKLSKRTKLYGFYTGVNNDANATYSAWSSLKKGESQSSLAVGMRHNF